MHREILQADRQRYERALRAYLHDCFSHQVAARVAEFAQSLRLSRQYVSRVFRRVLGQTVHEALRTRQLAQAEHLLRTTSLSTREIALRAGFGTQATMFRVFSAHAMMTPDQYRESATGRRRRMTWR